MYPLRPRLLVRRFEAYVEAMNRRDVDTTVAMFEPEVVVNGHRVQRDVVRHAVTSLLEAFPDFVWSVSEMAVTGRTVAVRMRNSGTHVRPYLGVAGTGRRIHVDDFGFYRFEGPLMAEINATSDRMLLRDQLLGLPDEPLRDSPGHHAGR
ncbi:MAG: ester cyclase [Nocardioidaceae bacterium]|nr:ester cyclase [Nocardioidaceae bacterium]